MTRRVTDWDLERLVDGELDEHSYRELLAALADEPDGWKRCALAFLENQALARDLSLPCIEPAKPTAPESTTAAEAASRRQFASLLLAIAASFLLAFVAGHEFQQWRSRGLSHSVVQDGPTMSPAQFTRAQRPRDDQQVVDSYSGAPLGSLQFVVDGPDGATSSIEVPVYSLNPLTSHLLANDRSAISPRVDEALEKLGREVHRSHFLETLELNDGRRVVIPVEQLEITPVSRTTY